MSFSKIRSKNAGNRNFTKTVTSSFRRYGNLDVNKTHTIIKFTLYCLVSGRHFKSLGAFIYELRAFKVDRSTMTKTTVKTSLISSNFERSMFQTVLEVFSI